jgi:hypothetical protein
MKDPDTSAHTPVVQSPTAQPAARGRDRLPQGAKVNMGYTDNHVMQLDITTDGKLSPNFISRKGEFTSLYSYGKDNPNWQPAWVQPCPGGGHGIFFQVPPGRTIPAGTLIGVYSGRNNISLSLSFDTAQKLFQASDYVLAYQPGGYVVDGQNGQNISGPARCNDNFGKWNPIAHRMELFTKAPLQEGLYEALVNYNEPGKSSVYWTPERLSLLPPDSRERCIAYYRTQLP